MTTTEAPAPVLTATKYPWQLYPLHVEALVWESPVLVGDDQVLRDIAGEALYMWARTQFDPDDHYMEIHRSAERTAFRGMLAFMSGRTGGGYGPRPLT